MRRVLTVHGTRPEAIKMAPLISALRRCSDLQVVVAVTGQHPHLLEPIHRIFGTEPDRHLDVFAAGQSLNALAARVLTALPPVIEAAAPDLLVVQGDTTTAAMAALAAFHCGVPVAHLEAGLRSRHPRNPFPEEANRRLIGTLADLHLAATAAARENLLREGIDAGAISVIGNTVIDALLTIRAETDRFNDPTLARLDGQPLVVVTTHRRESWGAPMRGIAQACATLARRYPDLQFVVPMHPNPTVRTALAGPLGGIENVHLIEPLDYPDLVRALDHAVLAITDSGGIQEEAPALGTPVVVTRETTERAEAVTCGAAHLAGTDPGRIVALAAAVLDDPHPRTPASPYGDGNAAQRAVAAIRHFFGLGPPAAEFGP